ncbi:hypothetical protein [Chryseobacterium sp.]|uniref:hypothetical protein n=1 Tax=Chryseobacterium sp. TaxID=1871047 RepID=UPI002FC9CE68
METINTIRELLDETPVLAEISNNLPPYYKIPITEKIKDLHTYLEEIHNKEMWKNGQELQKYSSDVLNELESQEFEDCATDDFSKTISKINKEFEDQEVVIIENFFGSEIKTSAFNNIIH